MYLQMYLQGVASRACRSAVKNMMNQQVKRPCRLLKQLKTTLIKQLYCIKNV